MAAPAGSGPAQDRRQHADELAQGFHVGGGGGGRPRRGGPARGGGGGGGGGGGFMG
ncbi:hypothetical protein [Nocardia brasiliensis]|uniref:hypothetical protein n=1 Tax=Nocardia brasiliensis TaxID=37326 RepID=UPI0024539DE4|nr:hypothetical protein [Nocardia brasiliensis]